MKQKTVRQAAKRSDPMVVENGLAFPAVAALQQKAEYNPLLQQQAIEDDLPAQGKFILQRAPTEEDEPMQGMFKPVQLQEAPEEEIQMQAFQRKENNTGMPDTLKSGLESMSGFDLSDVKVHHNSEKPAQLNAHAYAQGNEIHLGPGQEKHLPHEGWHVVQQRQGRVRPTVQMKQGIPVNDDPGLETEADTMGAQAMQTGSGVLQNKTGAFKPFQFHQTNSAAILQAVWEPKGDGIWYYNKPEETGNIRWYYHDETDRMVFNVDESNLHAKELEELKGDSYTWEQWMVIWKKKGWLDEVAIPDEKGEEKKDDQEAGHEMIHTIDNPDLCASLVHMWIKYGGDLRLFYNAKTRDIWHIDEGSLLHKEAKDLNLLETAPSAEVLINQSLRIYQQTEIAKAELEDRDELPDDFDKLPSGGMMHISLRLPSEKDAGHAVGIARLGTTYYVFDPNVGTIKVEGLSALKAVVKKNFDDYVVPDKEDPTEDDDNAGGESKEHNIEIIDGDGDDSDGDDGTEGGAWSDYTLYYVITIPDILGSVLK